MRPRDAGAVFIRDSGLRITKRRKEASLRFIIRKSFCPASEQDVSFNKKLEMRDEIGLAQRR
jgi:hypothetical protein